MACSTLQYIAYFQAFKLRNDRQCAPRPSRVNSHVKTRDGRSLLQVSHMRPMVLAVTSERSCVGTMGSRTGLNTEAEGPKGK